MFTQYDDIMSVEDVMEALNLGRSKVYDLLRTGRIKAIKLKGYRVPKAAVIDFVLTQTDMKLERYRELAD
ncbi:helix-turn-helix domain-containing protein [Brevibacillus fluminis]|uniref:helix-turn-helix domain-containing protein n=1 Tax=Brevibacillus TaxID=55080 RepID=UPI0030F77E6F